MEDNKIAKTAIIITVIAAVSKVLGFVREMVIAAIFGAGAVTDAYAVSAGAVSTATLLVATFLSITFIPAYARVREQHGEVQALKFTNNSLGITMVINLGFLVLLQIFAPIVINFVAPGFDAQQYTMAVSSLRILLFQLPFYTLLYLFSGYLTARKSFVGPNLIGLPLSLAVSVICIIMGTKSGVAGLSIANLVGLIAQASMLILWLPKEKYRLGFSFSFNTPEIRMGMKLLVPALLGSAVIDLNAWVDKFVSSGLGVGSVAAIGYSARLLTFVQGLIIFPIAGIIFSYISEYAAKKEMEKMLDTLWRTIRIVLFIVVPMVAIAIPSSFDVVHIVFERGEFDAAATALTSSAFLWYLPSLLGTAMYAFLVRFFYALQDTKTPMFYGAAAVAINIVLSIVLSKVMGIAGVALGTSIGSILSALFLLFALRRKIGPLGFGQTAKDLLKMLASVVPCVLAVVGLTFLLAEQSAILRFSVCVVGGAVLYLAAAFLLKESALFDIIGIIKRKANN